MKHAFITINGRKFPAPARGIEIEIITTVSDGRNDQNTFKGQRIGRDLQKLNSIVWPYLSADIWSFVLQQVSSFLFDVTYCDPVTNDWTTCKMYITNRKCKPDKLDPITGKTIKYKDCSCSFVDAGL